jgi:hypothetical protein
MVSAVRSRMIFFSMAGKENSETWWWGTFVFYELYRGDSRPVTWIRISRGRAWRYEKLCYTYIEKSLHEVLG